MEAKRLRPAQEIQSLKLIIKSKPVFIATMEVLLKNEQGEMQASHKEYVRDSRKAKSQAFLVDRLLKRW